MQSFPYYPACPTVYVHVKNFDVIDNAVGIIVDGVKPRKRGELVATLF